MKRKDPTLREITAAAVAQLFDIPREHVKLMSARQILSLINIDHDPVPFATARDLGWTPEQYNHPSNLTLRLTFDHKEKSAKRDTPQIAKSKRIADATEQFRRRLLAPKGEADGHRDRKSSRWPRTKMKSRKFARRGSRDERKAEPQRQDSEGGGGDGERSSDGASADCARGETPGTAASDG